MSIVKVLYNQVTGAKCISFIIQLYINSGDYLIQAYIWVGINFMLKVCTLKGREKKRKKTSSRIVLTLMVLQGLYDECLKMTRLRNVCLFSASGQKSDLFCLWCSSKVVTKCKYKTKHELFKWVNHFWFNIKWLSSVCLVNCLTRRFMELNPCKF